MIFAFFLNGLCHIPAPEKVLEKQRKRKRQRHPSVAMHSKKEKNGEGLGETPHSEVLLGFPTLSHPCNLSATSQGAVQSLGQVVFGWLNEIGVSDETLCP